MAGPYMYGRLWQLDRGAANDRIAHQAADVISVRTSVLIWPEHGREHNGKHDVEHAKRDLRCRGPKKGQQLEGNQGGRRMFDSRTCMGEPRLKNISVLETHSAKKSSKSVHKKNTDL